MRTRKDYKAMADTEARPDALAGKGSLSLLGLLIVQMIIGYEWLLSGIDKFASGDFASGLATVLADKAAGAPGWYAGFLNSLVIPDGSAFGYLIETAEVLAGIALIVGPLLWIFAWDRVPRGWKATALYIMIAAATGGVFMALNFHIANGSSHPWILPDSGFDEGVDVDLLLSAIQIVIVAVQMLVLNGLRRERIDVVPVGYQARQPKYT